VVHRKRIDGIAFFGFGGLVLTTAAGYELFRGSVVVGIVWSVAAVGAWYCVSAEIRGAPVPSLNEDYALWWRVNFALFVGISIVGLIGVPGNVLTVMWMGLAISASISRRQVRDRRDPPAPATTPRTEERPTE